MAASVMLHGSSTNRGTVLEIPPSIKCPPPDAAADTPEKPRLFWVCLKWKKVMDDFFHGQLETTTSSQSSHSPGLTFRTRSTRHFGTLHPASSTRTSWISYSTSRRLGCSAGTPRRKPPRGSPSRRAWRGSPGKVSQSIGTSRRARHRFRRTSHWWIRLPEPESAPGFGGRGLFSRRQSRLARRRLPTRMVTS